MPSPSVETHLGHAEWAITHLMFDNASLGTVFAEGRAGGRTEFTDILTNWSVTEYSAGLQPTEDCEDQPSRLRSGSSLILAGSTRQDLIEFMWAPSGGMS